VLSPNVRKKSFRPLYLLPLINHSEKILGSESLCCNPDHYEVMAELPICVILRQIVMYLKFFLTYLGIFIFIHILPVYVNSITCSFLILARKMLLLKGNGYSERKRCISNLASIEIILFFRKKGAGQNRKGHFGEGEVPREVQGYFRTIYEF
jgi:hypothetical protein